MPAKTEDERHEEVIDKLEEINARLEDLHATLTMINGDIEAIHKIARGFERSAGR